jgi:phospholipid/cholesterol/gamma-HCH transport system ATP-binding protein
MMSVIEAQGITTRLGGQLIHEHLDLTVRRGELLALVGGSGSGKTALLRHLIGLTRPAEGTVKLFGVEIARARSRDRLALLRRVGVLFQNGALFSALNVFDNIALPLRELRIIPEPLVRDLVLIKLAMVELQPEHARLMPAELSGGMVKRVALARALALDPELLILDEPTAGLDPDRSRAFVEVIREMWQELGLTVLMVTHDVDTLVQLATHVAVLADKRIMVHVPLAQVPAIDHPFVHSFFAYHRDLINSRTMQKPQQPAR